MKKNKVETNFQEHLSSQLNSAWEFRLNQKNDLAFELFYKISDYLGENTTSVGADFKISLLSLEASLLRWKKRTTEAQACLGEVKEKFSRTDIKKNYFYFLEMGLHYFSLSEYMDAFDYFIKAKTLASNEVYKFIALFNIYIVAEKLETPSKHIFAELKTIVKGIKKTPQTASLFNQYQHLRLNKLWKQGSLSALQAVDKQLEDTQALYLQLYLSKLSYTSLNFNLSNNDVLLIKNLYFSSYRMRTLTGKIHPDDFNIQNTEEIVDRLYLWVWKFLQNPVEFPIYRVSEYLAAIRFFSKSSLTEGARYKLRNIYLILGNLSKMDVSSMVNSFYFFSGDCHVVLDLEKNIFLYLSSNSEYKNDILEEIKKSPVFDDKKLFFKQLLEPSNKKTDKFYTLTQALHNKTPEVASIYKYVVNGKNNTLYLLNEDKSTVSKTFVDALSFLFNKSEVPCSAFFHYVCGISDYDSFVHSKRLWNILSKLKTICSEDFSYKVRNNIIYIKANWSKFYFIDRGIYLEQIQSSKIIDKLNALVEHENTDLAVSKKINLIEKARLEKSDFSEKTPSEEYLITSASKKDLEGFLSRKDLEIILNSSRSSVGRILKEWLEKQYISKKGSGKNTKYKLGSKIVSSLLKE